MTPAGAAGRGAALRGPAALRAVLVAEGGALAAELAPGDVPAPDPDPAAAAAAGPRAAGREAEIELAVRAVHAGAQLHYAECALLPISDPDLALLAGDRLYALGLERLAALGDVDAIAELADVIAFAAQAHASGTPALADAAWTLGAAAIAHGSGPSAADAKVRARAADSGAIEAMIAAGRALARPESVS